MKKTGIGTVATALLLLAIATPSTASQFGTKEAQDVALSFYRAVSNYSPDESNEMLLRSRPFFASADAYKDFRSKTQSSGYFDGAQRYHMTVSSRTGEARTGLAGDGSWHVSFAARVFLRPPEGVGLDRCVNVQVVVKQTGDKLGVASVVEEDCPTR